MSDVFCPANYALSYDSINGDKCSGPGGDADWVPPLGCVDSIDVVVSLNGAGKAPRVLHEDGCFEATGHSDAWGTYVEQCKVEQLPEGDDGSHHASTIVHNGNGVEVALKRVLHWGHARQWLFLLYYTPPGVEPNATINKDFAAGDVLYARQPSRPSGSPASVIDPRSWFDSTTACDVSNSSKVPYPLAR